eukprot:SM000091S24611  [mRNA]  locus=s91:330694:331649:+ [translate_table: standard]
MTLGDKLHQMEDKVMGMIHKKKANDGTDGTGAGTASTGNTSSDMYNIQLCLLEGLFEGMGTGYDSGVMGAQTGMGGGQGNMGVGGYQSGANTGAFNNNNTNTY